MADDNRADGEIVLGLQIKESFALIQQQLNQIAQKLKLRITGQLDTSATKKQLESDLKGVNVKQDVKIGAKIDKNAVKKQLKEDLKGLDGAAEVKINAKIEGADVLKELQSKNIDIDINADAAPLEDVGNGLDSVNKKSAATVASVYLLHRALSELQRAAEQMVATAIDLDRQLTELRMVTGGSYEEASRMIDSYNALARELGATTKQAAEAANEWLRQGKTVAETEELITQSMILSKVGAMTAAEATQNLTSAMKGYGLEVKDVSGIVDKLTAIDLQAAVTSSDLAEAMSRTAASANIAGVSMDKLLGYLTIMQEVTQKSATEIGTSMRSIFARLQNVKLGKFIDDETGEALNDTEKILKEFGIALRDANGNFRDMGDVLDEVGAKWNNFTSLEKSAIATAAAGTRQRENFLVLMENYGKALEYAGVAADSAGTAMQKFNAYQESIEAHMNTLTASAEALAKETIPADFVNRLLDASSAVLDFVTNTRLLSIALNTLGASMAIKGLSALTGEIRKAYNSVATLSQAFAILQKSADVSLSTEEFSRLIAVTKSLNKSQLTLVLSNQKLSQEQRIAILTSRGMTEQEAAQTLATMGLATAEGAATGATLSLSGAFKALGAAIAANPIGFLATALTMAISVITTFNQKAEEARQRMIDTAKSAAESSKKIGDLAAEYLTLTAALDENGVETEALTNARQGLIDALGLEQGEVDKLVEKYGNLTEAMRQAAIEELKRQGLDLSAGVDAARTQLIKDAKGDWTGQSTNAADMAWHNANADNNNRALGIIRGMGYLANPDNVRRTGRISLTTEGFDTSTVEGTIASYERLQEILTAIRDEIGTDNDVYKALYAQYEDLTEAVDTYRDTVSASNENIVQTAMLEQLHGQSVAKTQEEFDAYRQTVIDAVAADQNYIGSTNDVAAAVDNVLSRESSFAGFYGKVTETVEATTEAVTELADTLTTLAGIEGTFDKLTKAMGEFDKSGAITAETLLDLKQTFGNLDSFQHFANVLTDVESTEEQVQAATDALAAEWLSASGELQAALDSVTEETAEATAALLENMGVENADALVKETLAARSLETALAQAGLTDAAWDQVEAFLQEAGASQTAIDALESMRKKQFEAKLATIDFSTATDDTISGLVQMAQAANIAGKAMEILARMQSFSLSADDSYKATSDYAARMAKFRGMIQDAMSSDVTVTLPRVNVNRPSSGSSGRSGSATKSETEFDRLYKYHQHLLAMDQESVEDYIKWLDSAYQEAYKKGEIDLDKYYKYQEEVFTKIRSMLDDVRKAHENAITLTQKWLDQAIAGRDFNKIEQYTKDIVEHYRQMQEAVHKEAEYYRSLGYEETSDEISKLSALWWQYRDSIIAAMKNAYDQMQKFHENSITLTENWLNNAVEQHDYSSITRNVNAIIAHYKAMQEQLHEQAEYYRSLGYSDTSDEVSKLSDLWWDYYDAIKNVSANAWGQLVDNAHDALDAVQSVFDTLKSAAQEYAESGHITVDTLQAICKLGVEYLAYIEDENGQLVINEETINRVIAAKTEQMAVETALNYVNQIGQALEEGKIDTLNRLIFAQDAATKSTWDLVRAQVEALDLTDAQYSAVMQRINTLQSLTYSAVHSIGNVNGAVKKEIEDTKDALDDLLKYVEAMIKQEVENQIDALEGQVKAYKEIVGLQKKALDLERRRDDYAQSVEEKTKRLADLQSKIALLDLDSSRDAQAEKAKLAEEMSDLQRDLSKTQADYAYNTTVDALDDMADAYEREKNKEITVLRDSISSTEKLYRAAIQRIDQGWGSLYDDLINWAYQYGNVTQQELTSCWAAASQAVQQYGSYLEAVAQTQAQLASFDAGSFTTIGQMTAPQTTERSETNTRTTVKGLVAQMKQNSAAWFDEGADKKALEKANEQLAAQIAALLNRNVVKDSSKGIWYLDAIGGKTLYSQYHSGGVAGNTPELWQDELFAKLKKGEMVLTERQQEGMYRMIEAQETLLSRFGGLFDAVAGNDMAAAQMQEHIRQSAAAAAQTVTNNQQSINVEVNAPIQTVQKLDEAEIKQLSRRIGNDTISTINNEFFKAGKKRGLPLLKP